MHATTDERYREQSRHMAGEHHLRPATPRSQPTQAKCAMEDQCSQSAKKESAASLSTASPPCLRHAAATGCDYKPLRSFLTAMGGKPESQMVPGTWQSAMYLYYFLVGAEPELWQFACRQHAA